MADTSYKDLLSTSGTRPGLKLDSSSLEHLATANTISYSYELDDLFTPRSLSEPRRTVNPWKLSTTFGHSIATWIRKLLRSFRLLFPMAVAPWSEKDEHPKIAMYTHWVSVLTGLLVHVMPLAASIALIYLNIASYRVVNHVSTLTFQFLAKFLELLAQASLGSAVFAYLRFLTQARSRYLLEHCSLIFKLTSYLWSLEFAGVITSLDFRRTQKFAFLLLIPLSVIIGVGVGPSFAIALIPTLGNFYGGWGEAWVNVMEEQIFPSKYDPDVFFVYDCTTRYCAKDAWETAMTIAQSSRQSTVMYNTQQGSFALTQDAPPNREIRWNTSDGLSDSSFRTDLFSLSATVTIPNQVVAWSLNHLAQESYSTKHWPTGNQNFTLTSRQPIVTASCGEVAWLDSTTLYTTFQNKSDQYVLQSESLGNSTDPSDFQWVFLDHDRLIDRRPSRLNPSVWILSRWPFPDGITSPTDWGLCALYAGYSHVHNTVSSSRETYLVSNKLVGSQTDRVSASSIPIPGSWLNWTLPTLSTLLNNGLTDVDMATFLATSTAISMAQWPRWIIETPDNSEDVFGDIIIENPRSNDSGYVNPSLRWLAPSTGDHVFFAGSEYARAQGKYRLRMDVSTYGYGYQINQTTKVIAICVLVAYCLFILTFVILMLTLSRVHSNAWDSIGELTALAIMSKPDKKLRNTSAGIETVALSKLPVNIRANDNNHLEIVFGDDEDGLKAGVVEKNKRYE